MSQKLIVGPVSKGLKNNMEPFYIDNDSFPTLVNAYEWRGRIKRKRGNSLIGRLSIFFDSTNPSFNPNPLTLTPQPLANDGFGNGTANLFTLYTPILSVTNVNLVPGTITITDTSTGPPNVYTDPNSDGVLVGTPSGSGTVNYATGVILITAAAGDLITATFSYYQNLPVLGLEELNLTASQFPGSIAFDQTKSYNITPSTPFSIYNVSFYKNTTSPTHKTNSTPVSWNVADWEQFWSTNYQGALWVTPGIKTSTDLTNIGMQFQALLPGSIVMTIAPGPPAIIQITFTVPHNLVVGDYVFLNEFQGITGVNDQTGFVSLRVDAFTVQITLPSHTVLNVYTGGGIVQYLTNTYSGTATQDPIRWYDGDPTNGTGTYPTGTKGWVNFSPPLSSASFAIDENPLDIYYLAGAKVILPYKDRLVFFGPVIQTSTGKKIYLQDTVIYSQNGTPYYTCTFTQPVTKPTNVVPLIVPDNQTAVPTAFFEDLTGFGGYFTAGLSQPIITAGPNEDVIIIGFSNKQIRMTYTGNDIVPFNMYIVNSEFGSGSTFSIITQDRGVITTGNRGIILTTQVSSERIDIDIPDQIFRFNLQNNGIQRVTAQRDFINEWTYITYPSNQVSYRYPNQTLIYNYREGSWGIFNECYTTYGQFQVSSGLTWLTVGNYFSSWSTWDQPWNAGSSTLDQPKVIAGNQQGFVFIRDQGTSEPPALYIQSIDTSTPTTLYTSIDHCLNIDDFIIIDGALGTIGAFTNGRIFQIATTTNNTFTVTDDIPSGVYTYLGAGTITRLYRPFVQTKQFPMGWGLGRKTRIGSQMYLLTNSGINQSQIELQIYLSQDSSNAWNFGPIVPDPLSVNNSLVYTDAVYTCPESLNLGLTPTNTNLQQLNLIDEDSDTSTNQQAQIWHRMNTSLLGDTVQLAFTISDDQMALFGLTGPTVPITLIVLGYPTVLTATNTFAVGQMLFISAVRGTEELNGNMYQIVSVTGTTITINVDSTLFTAYAGGGTATQTSPVNIFSEIELHGFVIDVSPSQLLA